MKFDQFLLVHLDFCLAKIQSCCTDKMTVCILFIFHGKFLNYVSFSHLSEEEEQLEGVT